LELDGTSVVARRIVDGGFEQLRVPLPAGPPGDVPPAAPFLGDPSVWVVCELTDGKPARVSLELLSKATELAPALGGPVAAVLAGDQLSSAVDELVGHGLDVVFVAQDEALDRYRAEPHARVVAQLAADHHPTAVLFGATTTGRDLAPRVAALLDTGLAADAPTSRWRLGSAAAFASMPCCIRSGRQRQGACSPPACAPRPARRWRRYAPAFSNFAPCRGTLASMGISGVGAHRSSGGRHRP
jgi:hypothetical protein